MPRLTDVALRKEITARFLKALAVAAAERNLTMEEVAARIGVKQSNLSRLKNPETGSGVTITMLYNAWLIFDISPEVIITGEEQTPNKVMATINKRLAAIEKAIKQAVTEGCHK